MAVQGRGRWRIRVLPESQVPATLLDLCFKLLQIARCLQTAPGWRLWGGSAAALRKTPGFWKGDT